MTPIVAEISVPLLAGAIAVIVVLAFVALVGTAKRRDTQDATGVRAWSPPV